MTSRERILTAFGGGVPDRVPVSPFGFGKIDPDSDLGRELVAKTDILVDAGVGGNVFLGQDAVVERSSAGGRTVITYQTSQGPLTEVWQSTGITQAAIEHPLKCIEDVEKVLSIPYSPPEIDTSGYLAWVERIGDEGLVLAGVPNAVCMPASWFSPEGFCLAWAEHQQLLIELTEEMAGRVYEYVKLACEAGVKAFRIIGGEYVTVQLGPAAVPELLTAFDKELIAMIHSYGAVAYYHNHGRVLDFLPALADLGMDALDPLEAPPWGDVDLGEARKRAGDRLCFVGNLDDMEVVNSLPEEQVLEIARARLKQAGSRAFLLGGTASGTYSEEGARNFIAMAKMVEAES